MGCRCRVQLCAPSGQYFAATVTLSNNVPELKFDDQDGYAAACRGQYASVQDGLSEIVKAGIKSGNSFKEIGSDFYSGLKNRGDKAFDSPYDFLNWATLGIPDILKATVQANAERSEKAFDSVYDGINWISFGSADMVKGTFDPEDPLSKEHWLNSFGTASVIFGGSGATSSIEKASMIDHIPNNEILNKNIYVNSSKISDGTGKANKSLQTKIPYEFMKDTVDHIFNGVVKNPGTVDEYATGWHYMGSGTSNGNKIIQITKNADEFGTIEAKVEIGGVTKDGISTLFSDKYTPNEVVDMITQAHMNKTLVPSSRGLYRGVADNGMTIEMYLYRNPEGCNISDVITAYPVHADTLK